MNTIIYMRTVPGKPLHRALTKPLQITTMDGEVDEIPVDFEWDGASVPWLFNGLFPIY